jgi:hypothetical protein
MNNKAFFATTPVTLTHHAISEMARALVPWHYETSQRAGHLAMERYGYRELAESFQSAKSPCTGMNAQPSDVRKIRKHFALQCVDNNFSGLRQ